MKAAQFYGAKDIRVLDVPVPEPKANEILVAVEWCGICGTDLHEYLHGPLGIPTAERKHPLTGSSLPVTMGHEFCGRVLKTAEGSSLKVGQQVMVDPRLNCQSCAQCNISATNSCDKWGFLGLSGGGGGGFSEVVAVDARMCHGLPDSAPLEYAALIEPLAVAAHAVNLTHLKDLAGKSILVIGGGPIGMAVAIIARSLNAHRVIVSEPTLKRREQAIDFADVVINPLHEDVVEKCQSATNGKGVDLAFDCAGIQVGLESGSAALRYGGIYVNLAGWSKPAVIPQLTFMKKEITFRSSFAYDEGDFKQVVSGFNAGIYKGLEQMVTSRIGLDNIVQGGFEQLINNRDEHIKILITPKQQLVA